jgi:flavin-dependent dehydrogenase
LKRATSLGVQFVTNFLTSKLIEEGGRVRGFISHDGSEVRAKYTIIADGAHSRFTVDRGPKAKMQAIMGWWDNVPFKHQHVEMVFDKMVSPLYGWLFPENDGRVNIGICYEDGEHTKNARQLFQQFLDKHYAHRLSNAKQIGDWKGHPIVYSYQIDKLYSPGRMVIGEAGRMTHPATAEGISQGMRTGMWAARALSDILTNKVGEAEAFARYQSQCKRAFWLSFNAAKIFRKVVDSSLMDNIVAVTQQPTVKRAVGRLMAEM